MNRYKKLYFLLLFSGFFSFLPISSALAENSRFFVKSTSNFWKNSLGVRHSFDGGFTADLSDFQLGLTKLFRLDVEPVNVLHVLPGITTSPAVSPSQAATDNTTQQANIFFQGTTTSPTPTGASPTPQLTSSPTPVQRKAIRNKKGAILRYLPTDQVNWGVETIYQDSKLTETTGGRSVKVAVLDTGVYIGHPDLKANISECKDFTNSGFSVVDQECEDKNGHGTHVAGIVAANAGKDKLGIYGIAPQAKIYAFKVCDDEGSCYADDVAAGIQTAVDDGAQIINMSFGADRDIGFVKNAIDYAAQHGVLMVAAAGNDGPYPDSIDYPAAYKEVIAVGAINDRLNVADWSSRGVNDTHQAKPYVVQGRDIEFAAPGENIESTWKNGGYAVLSGTSMASPFVSGLAAKLWQFSSSDPAVETRKLLDVSARDLAPDGNDNASGLGLPVVVVLPSPIPLARPIPSIIPGPSGLPPATP